MPWKGIKDIYKIWISEIILQQTRVEQGLGYYQRFIETFPTIQDLAKASERKVMKLWEGLGYYSRCRNLHHTAKHIVENLNGNFPTSYEGLLALKGIGPYTAAAISSFGYNIPKAVIDGNVIRIMSRYFGITEATDSTQGKKILSLLAEQCLDATQPGIYNQAIMDFGATICKPTNPLCSGCVLKNNCKAYHLGKVDALPVTAKKLIKKKRWFIVIIITWKQQIAIQKRTTGDIWSGLYAFPIIEKLSKKEWTAVSKNPGAMYTNAIISTHEYRQQLTHQTIHARIHTMEIARKSACPEKVEWVHKKDFTQLAFPKLIRDIIDKERLLS